MPHDESLLPERCPRLSIVIPAFNEENRLPRTLSRLTDYLDGQTYAWEIVVVSNGSTDGTAAVVRGAAQSRSQICLIEIPVRGKGIAAKTGVLRSRGEVIFLCDADLSMPPENLGRFLDALETHDVVIGSREAAGSRRYHEPWHRHVMGRIFNSIVRLWAIKGIEDTQCGFKAFRRRAARELFSRQIMVGFGFDVEVLFLAQKYGYKIDELGIDWYFDADTRVRPGVDTMHMLGELFLIRLRELLGHYRRLPPESEPYS